MSVFVEVNRDILSLTLKGVKQVVAHIELRSKDKFHPKNSMEKGKNGEKFKCKTSGSW